MAVSRKRNVRSYWKPGYLSSSSERERGLPALAGGSGLMPLSVAHV